MLTIRVILSQISMALDSFRLMLPGTTKGKLLMREFWCQNFLGVNISESFLCD